MRDFKRLLLHNTEGISFVSDNCSRVTLRVEKLKILCAKFDVALVRLAEINKE